MESGFTILIDFLGCFAFAISGIKLASTRQIDWFGAYVIGLATAIGGGTTRDLLLGIQPFWMSDGKYFLVPVIALAVFLLFKEKVFRWKITLFIFDAIGLGLFTVVGISTSLAAGLPFWVCVVMGTITGSVGGVIRDVLLNEVPLLFRRDIYSLACVIGGLVYLLCMKMPLTKNLTELTTAVSVILVRIIAVRFHIHLPQLKR